MNAYHPVINTLKGKFFKLAAKENGDRSRNPRVTAELDMLQEQIRALQKEAESFVPAHTLYAQTICHLSL